MRKILKHAGLLMGFIFLLFSQSFAQTFFTRNGEVSFHSNTPLENVDGVTKEATCVMDLSTGEVAFAVLMKSFQFRKALMQEHFNENYVESSKYPKATFKGKILDPKAVDVTKNGTYPVEVEGDMTIHGVTKKIKAPGTIQVKGKELLINSSFTLAPEDFNIEIPSVVRQKIAKVFNVKVNTICQPFSN